ncbi:MAG TPA: nuclear transport factor 2 family protein [Holophagaceae bacterium]|nr:nuclear transport factor 2 family protein [Holophagaceae bacterium]
MRRIALLLAAALALPVLAQAPGPEKKIHLLAPGAKWHAKAQALNDAFAAAMVKGDAEAIAEAYTQDAELFFFKGETPKGRVAIRATLDGMLKGMQVKAMAITSEETYRLGADLFDQGHYEMTTVADGKETTAKGRYLQILRKGTDGKWRLWRDCPLPD